MWEVDALGWPRLKPPVGDGSLSKWLEAQAQRQRARGVELMSNAQRQQAVSSALLAVGSTAGAVGTAAPPVLIVAGLASALGLIVRAGPGGLAAANDRDRDGVPDVDRDGRVNPPTPEEDVGQWARGWVAYQLAPAFMGGGRGRSAPLPASEFFTAAIQAKGVDLTYFWWLLKGQQGNRAWYPNDGVLEW